MIKKIISEIINIIFEQVFIFIPQNVFSKVTFIIKNKRLPENSVLLNDYIFNQKINNLNYDKGFFSKEESKRKALKLDKSIKIIETLYTIYNLKDLNSIKQRSQDLIFKSNIGSQSNFILNKDDKINFKVKLLVYLMLKRNHFLRTRENQYKGNINSIIVEPLIKGGLDDFKVFCYKQSPKILQVDLGRFNNHSRNIYNFEDGTPLDLSLTHPFNTHFTLDLSIIRSLEDHCFLLSKPFEFIRLDFYIINTEIYFGEFTLNPGNGNESFGNIEQEVLFSNILFDEN